LRSRLKICDSFIWLDRTVQHNSQISVTIKCNSFNFNKKNDEKKNSFKKYSSKKLPEENNISIVYFSTQLKFDCISRWWSEVKWSDWVRRRYILVGVKVFLNIFSKLHCWSLRFYCQDFTENVRLIFWCCLWNLNKFVKQIKFFSPLRFQLTHPPEKKYLNQ
jgi:hypothetical protein